jgi:ketosteroid isomerase-like protein
VETDPESIVRAAIDRLNAHDLDGYYELCADDFAYIGTTERRGKAAARAVDEPLFAGLPDHWRRVEKLLVCGDTVAVWLCFGGTPRATGRAFEVELCDVIEVRDARIQSIRIYADFGAFTAKLSAWQSPVRRRRVRPDLAACGTMAAAAEERPR